MASVTGVAFSPFLESSPVFLFMHPSTPTKSSPLELSSAWKGKKTV